MLDQNLWAVCGFGSGLNISFLTHQNFGGSSVVCLFVLDILASDPRSAPTQLDYEVQVATPWESVCGQQMHDAEARFMRGLRWHLGW